MPAGRSQGFPLMSWTSSNSKEAAVHGTAACAAVPAVDGCGAVMVHSARRVGVGLRIPNCQAPKAEELW